MWQTTPLKTLSEKPLPPRLTLRAQNSPERRGMFDATDLTATSLNGRFPPLESASSPESVRSDQKSPDAGSFQATPSLLSRNQSPNSVSTGVVEYGVATSTTIQSVINPHISVDTEHAHDPSSSKYILNAPSSTKIPRHSSVLHHNHQPKNRTPSRSSGHPSSRSKVNRSMLRGREAISVRGRNSLAMGNARRGGQGTVQQEDVRSDLSLASPISGVFIERARTKDLL